ncbi:AAA family ATPase [Anaerococcus sp.]|uniref:AAA family ATPase n=1 Tax=Anaerococcus sp. TaxID=1872515 RepID=UPI00280AD1AD|nr:AAA family ATPase [Anaerococcus sp.]MDU3212304.1 AAA family ATPase [Anaerococcus sp.]
MKIYYLPKIKELHISNYDLYICPFDVEFSEKINFVFGTNGLGKTTFLNIMQYSIIGPYIGKVESRNWKEQQKLKRPTFEKYYFRNRMREQSDQAEVRVLFYLGNDKYEVIHSLYEHRLKKVFINDKEISGENINYDTYEKKYFGQDDQNIDRYLIDKYHKHLEKSSNFPDINAFMLMLTEIMFFTESRDLSFWNQDMTKLILSKFMPTEKYFEYDEVQKLIKKYDSQERLTSYKMSMIKEFLGDDLSEKNTIKPQYSLKDLQNINNNISEKNKRIRKYEQELNKKERERKQNRIDFESVGKQLLETEQQWYNNVFPDKYQKIYNKYVPSILDDVCPFCGENHINKILEVDKCFYCNKPIKVRKNIDLNRLEIERKNLDNKKRRLQNNYSLINKEIFKIKKLLAEENKELFKVIEEQQKVKKTLDLTSNDNFAKYQQLELKKQEYHELLEQTKQREKKLASEIDAYVLDRFQDYSTVFNKYAYSFLGNDSNVRLELVGKTDEAFFKFFLNETERESETALSESQRIFVDMAYRLATLEFFHKDSYFISETPDSTLDYFFETNAVKTFSYFIDSGNTLFMSANARNSRLINLLIERYKKEHKLINLLEKSTLAQKQLDEIRQLEFYSFLEE